VDDRAETADGQSLANLHAKSADVVSADETLGSRAHLKASPNLANISWLIGTFDTAGEVSFAGISTLTNTVFGFALNLNHTYFRLRQQSP
jgi:hypothetical protein